MTLFHVDLPSSAADEARVLSGVDDDEAEQEPPDEDEQGHHARVQRAAAQRRRFEPERHEQAAEHVAAQPFGNEEGRGKHRDAADVFRPQQHREQRANAKLTTETLGAVGHDEMRTTREDAAVKARAELRDNPTFGDKEDLGALNTLLNTESSGLTDLNEIIPWLQGMMQPYQQRQTPRFGSAL